MESKVKKEGRVFTLSNGTQMCNECCNGDRCDDSSHYYRKDCPYCGGTGYNLTADNHNKSRIVELPEKQDSTFGGMGMGTF